MRRTIHTLTLLAVVALLVAPAARGQAPPPVAPVPEGTAFDGNGMWIWYLSQSSGGDLDAIAERARAAGITTLFVKSSDGANPWRQFSARLVEALHARGLKACGWGYVYGNDPRGEARAARTAIRAGADCFVIDAETEYEGKYVSASTYMRKLRAYAGEDYPIGVAPFPYVDYHPGYPYSVFLGPGGAQFNLPQMYWRAIGTSVANVYSRTYAYGTLYGRPIYPLGQTYGGVRRAGVIRFRQYAHAYGARGASWWSWQATPSAGWSGLAAPLAALPAGQVTPPVPATLTRGARGDLIVWAQQHLRGAGRTVRVNGVLDGRTAKALRIIQRDSALPITGSLDPVTWRVLLATPPAKIRWRRAAAGARAAGSGSAPSPLSARLRAKRNEIGSARPR